MPKTPGLLRPFETTLKTCKQLIRRKQPVIYTAGTSGRNYSVRGLRKLRTEELISSSTGFKGLLKTTATGLKLKELKLQIPSPA